GPSVVPAEAGDAARSQCSSLAGFEFRTILRRSSSRWPNKETLVTAASNRQIILAETPKGKLGQEHFRMSSAPVPDLKEGEVLLRERYISLDAANRVWLRGATYPDADLASSVMTGLSLRD